MAAVEERDGLFRTGDKASRPKYNWTKEDQRSDNGEHNLGLDTTEIPPVEG